MSEITPTPANNWAIAKARYEAGLYLQAQEAVAFAGDPRTWKNAHHQTFGARLANNLGAPRLAGSLITRAFRQDRKDPEIRLHYAYRMMNQRGLWPAWQFLKDTAPSDDPDTRASLLALQGVICAKYRDASTATAYIHQAIAAAPGNPWMLTEWSRIHEALDDRDAAITSAREALSIHPWYRPAVQQLLHLLLEKNDDEAAEEIFREANARLECGYLVQQWIVACSEREVYKEIPAYCSRSRELLAWAENAVLDWLKAREMDAHYALGDFDRAAALAEELKGLEDFAAKLRAPGLAPRRAKIAVPFVRQDDSTCAPASLASVASHWKWDITHDEIVEAVCYGGTYPHTLRKWITDRGWMAREFQVTWTSLQALIDAGVPFLLATNDAGGGHMQVVEGYDALREEILIRDPNFRHHRQVDQASFLQRYAAFGPRGLIVLPPAEASRLQGIPLDAESGFDRLHSLSLALEANDRATAAENLEALISENAPPFLQFAGRLALAQYDANPLERLKCLEDMEAVGLRHPMLTQMRLDIGRDFRGEMNYLEKLRIAADPRSNAEGWDPSTLLTLAIELSPDDRNFAEVRRLFHRYHSLCPQDASALSFWGKVLWTRQQRDAGLQLLRFACTAADKNEQFAADYSTATQLLGVGEQALSLLRERAEKAGAKSWLPYLTLYNVLRSSSNDAEAFAALQKALSLRPADTDLLLFCAQEWAMVGDRNQGRAFLEQARPQAQPTRWRRIAARFAALEGDIATEQECWSEVARVEPFAMDAHGEIARLLLNARGPMAAVAYWDELRLQFPFHLEIANRAAVAALAIGESFSESYFQTCQHLAPSAAEPRLELIRISLDLGRLPEAAALIDELKASHPHLAPLWYWLGRLREEQGRFDEAREAYWQALRRNVDLALAAQRLRALADGSEEQNRLIEALAAELESQPFGDEGFACWFDFASAHLAGDTLEELLSRWRSRRQSSWMIWHCSIQHALNQGHVASALDLVEELCERFSLLTGTWLEAAEVQERSGRLDLAETSLRRALHINPFASQTWIRLAGLLNRSGRAQEAREVLTTSLLRFPNEAVLHWALADLLREEGLIEPALAELRSAISADPSLSGAWDAFASLCQEAHRLTHLRDFALGLNEARPGNVNITLEAARACLFCGQLEEAEALARQTLEIQPRLIRAHLVLSEILAQQSNLQGALEACESSVWDGAVPAILLGQAAWWLRQQNLSHEAIDKMRQAVRKDPTYAWGWERLAEWLVDRNPPGEALDPAQHAASLQPRRGYAWYLWATIHKRVGNRGEALRVLSEAVAREPAFGHGLMTLVGWLCVERKIVEAEAITKRSGTVPPEMHRLASQALIASATKRHADAALTMEQLIRLPGTDYTLLDHLATLLAPLSGKSALLRTIYECLWKPGIRPAAIAYWIDSKLRASTWDLGDSLLALPVENDARTEGLFYYLRQLNSMGHGEAALPLLRRHSAHFHSDDRLWSALGLCLIVITPSEVWRFMSDWRSRPNATPDMLRTASIAALSQGHLSEAFEISRSALAGRIRDSSFGYHWLIAALEHAKLGNSTAAAEALALGKKSINTSWDVTLSEVIGLAVETAALESRLAGRRWSEGKSILAARNKLNEPLMTPIATAIDRHLQFSRGGLMAFRPPPLPSTSNVPPPPPLARAHRHLSRWPKYAYIATGIFWGFLIISALLAPAASGDEGVAALVGLLFIGSLISGMISCGLSATAIWKTRFRQIGPYLALSASTVLPVLGLVAITAAVSTPAARLTNYEEPSGAFQLNLHNAGRVSATMVSLPHAKGISVTTGEGNVIEAVATSPEEGAAPLINPVPVVRQMLDDARRDRSLNAREYIDHKGRPWVRTIAQVTNDQGVRMTVLRDATASRDKIIIMKVFAPAETVSEKDIEETLAAAWHKRLVLPNLPPDARAAGEASSVGDPGNSATASPALALPEVKPGDILAVDRTNPDALLAHAKELSLTGRLPEAESAAREAASLAPQNIDTWLFLALVCNMQKKTEEGMKAAITAIKLAPDREDAWTLLHDAGRQQQDLLAMETTLKDLLAQMPDNPIALRLLANVQFESGMPRIALSTMKQALAAAPNNPDTLNQMGEIHALLGEHDTAKDLFAKALNAAPRHGGALNNYGYAMLEESKPYEAITYLEKAVQVEPQSARALINLATAYIAVKEFGMAASICDRIEPLNAQAAAELRARLN